MHVHASAPPADVHGGRPFLPALAGAALSLLFAAALYFFPVEASDLLALLLAATGGVYFGAAVATGRRGWVIVEGAAALSCIVMAALGLWWSSVWIAAGFAAHGVWDVLHHPRAVRTPVRRWFPPFCAAFDWLVALYILFLR